MRSVQGRMSSHAFSMGGILYVIVVYSLRTVYVIAIGPVRNRGGRVGNTDLTGAVEK